MDSIYRNLGQSLEQVQKYVGVKPINSAPKPPSSVFVIRTNIIHMLIYANLCTAKNEYIMHKSQD